MTSSRGRIGPIRSREHASRACRIVSKVPSGGVSNAIAPAERSFKPCHLRPSECQRYDQATMFTAREPCAGTTGAVATVAGRCTPAACRVGSAAALLFTGPGGDRVRGCWDGATGDDPDTPGILMMVPHIEESRNRMRQTDERSMKKTATRRLFCKTRICLERIFRATNSSRVNPNGRSSACQLKTEFIGDSRYHRHRRCLAAGWKRPTGRGGSHHDLAVRCHQAPGEPRVRAAD